MLVILIILRVRFDLSFVARALAFASLCLFDIFYCCDCFFFDILVVF